MKTSNKFQLNFLIGLVCLLFSFNQVFFTTLKVTVRNELGNVEQGVGIQLYDSEEDYREEKNPATQMKYTNDKGNVLFKKLEHKVYYVNAIKGDKNNNNAGVRTDSLQSKKINKITIIIE